MIEDSAIPVRPRKPPTVQITEADVRRAVDALYKSGIIWDAVDKPLVVARLCDLLGLKETPNGHQPSAR